MQLFWIVGNIVACEVKSFLANEAVSDVNIALDGVTYSG